MQRYTRKIALIIGDLLLINFAFLVALGLRFEWAIPKVFWNNIIYIEVIGTVILLISFYSFGLYRSLWRYASEDELSKVMVSSVVGVFSTSILTNLLGFSYPRSAFIISLFLLILFVGGLRFSYRVLRSVLPKFSINKQEAIRVLVIGAGDGGAMLVKELKNNHLANYQPVAIIDDDPWKWGAKIHNVPIKGGVDKLGSVCREEDIQEIIFAIPTISKKRRAEILEICEKTQCKLKTIPGLYEIVDNKVSISSIRDVSIEDLLERDEVVLDTSAIAGYIEDQVVLVTGAGGSIGSELCRQLIKFNPKKLILLDNYENTAYELYNEIHGNHPNLDVEVIIASIREKERMEGVFKRYRPHVVFHAAAHKHVALMENNPEEAFKNNVLGTLNIANCANEFSVKKFVFISTDKAVNPTNVMGATKRLAEMVIQSINKESQTDFVAVRFGNVLGSNGSVVPIFKKQIAKGGPVTVTHPEVTRFFMTIPEAVRLVIQAGAMAKGGEIFVLDMGQPVKILDLAKKLIKLSGFEPNKDIKIQFTGLKPGEKLYEELLLKEEGVASTKHKDIFVAKPIDLTYQDVMEKINQLTQVIEIEDELIKKLAQVVPTYQSFRKDFLKKEEENDKIIAFKKKMGNTIEREQDSTKEDQAINLAANH